MNNEREILFDSVAAIINIQPTNEMFLRGEVISAIYLWLL